MQRALYVRKLYDDHPVPADVSDDRARCGRCLREPLVGACVLGDVPRLRCHGTDLGAHRRPQREASHGNAREPSHRDQLPARRARHIPRAAHHRAPLSGICLRTLADGSRHHDALCAAGKTRLLPRHHAGHAHGGRCRGAAARRRPRGAVRDACELLYRWSGALHQLPRVHLYHQRAADAEGDRTAHGGGTQSDASLAHPHPAHDDDREHACSTSSCPS